MLNENITDVDNYIKSELSDCFEFVEKKMSMYVYRVNKVEI